jgi:hypothetical protein
MGLTSNEFEKKLNQLLAGELPDDQLADLEDFAAQDIRADRKLDQVKNLQVALHQSAREYRRTTYPGNLAAEIQARAPARPIGTIRRRRWAFALAATLVVISSLVLILRDRPAENRVAAIQPSLTDMADINRGLSEFKMAHSRHLADWSKRATLEVPNPGAIKITGLRIPDRPTMCGLTGIRSKNQEGAKL